MFASYLSSLRVYEPVAALDVISRARWADEPPRERAEALLGQRRSMLQAVLGPAISFSRLAVEEDALLATWRGARVVCPLDTHSRALQALVDSEWKLPFPLGELVIGRTVRRQAAGRQLRPRQAGARESKDHVLTASWDVPFWWSLLFTTSDVVRHGAEELIYRTAISDALARGQRALELITQAFGVTPFISDLDLVVRWLGSFDDGSMVELDYGSLTGLIDSLSEGRDDSMALAGRAIEQLAEGDLEESMSAYQEYTSTWEEIGRLESWN